MIKRALLLIICLSSLAAWVVPDASALSVKRRRPQFSKDNSGYIVLPAPYSIEGIGRGVAFFAASYNIAGTNTDGFVDYLAGDIQGSGAGLTELHIIPERLFVDFTYQDLSKAKIQSYSQRGMDASGDDYIILGMDDVIYAGGRVTLSMRERIFELYAMGYGGSFRVKSLRDNDGKKVAETDSPARDSYNLFGPGFTLDLTDDRLDPRRGVRFDTSLCWSVPGDDFSSEYRVHDANITGYVPMGKRSTWVFNYFQSNAALVSEGETDPLVMARELGFDCGNIIDPERRARCQGAVDEYVDVLIAANRYGTATSLGGRSRLRSYPDERFNGAHSSFLGTEFRWNVTEEFTPFDIKVVRDIRTAVQLAFFYELGTYAETTGDLWEKTDYSAGTGLRIINASGLIYRLDYASGEEGQSLTIIINYPWETF